MEAAFFGDDISLFGAMGELGNDLRFFLTSFDDPSCSFGFVVVSGAATVAAAAVPNGEPYPNNHENMLRLSASMLT